MKRSRLVRVADRTIWLRRQTAPLRTRIQGNATFVACPRTHITLPDLNLPGARKRFYLLRLALLLFGILSVHSPAAAQQDTTASESTATASWWRRLPEDHSPRGALWRAAAVPGWGQVYNRQLLKLPFVYGGLAGITATALTFNREYILFRRAALYAEYEGDADPDPEFCTCYEDEYLRVVQKYGVPDVEPGTLRQVRDNYRRNRDLSYFGIGLVYGLTVLDAYVSAHLLDFDVGEDLTLSIQPTPAGATAALRWTR